jgi:bifunctional enzyme CysN/CysC
MDLVDFSEKVFNQIREDFLQLTGRLCVDDVRFFPVSALLGDNVVEQSTRMPWHAGGPLLPFLEELETYDDPVKRPMRMPVQYVIRPMKSEYHDYRGYAGSIAGGSLVVGQEIKILPSGATSRVVGIETPDGDADQAGHPTAVTVRIADDLDISRGDVFASMDQLPRITQELDATICWMSDKSELREGAVLKIKHTTRTARAMITGLVSRIDMATMTTEPGIDSMRLNEIGRVTIRTSMPLVCDDYTANRVTGSFILIDEATNDTVAAGMIGAPSFGEFAAPA